MSKRIVIVHGAPRKKGNTRAVTRLAAEAARREGAVVTEIDVTKLAFSTPGCIGCAQCQQSDTYECTLGDELARSVATLAEYDVIVFSTPLYWWSYSAQLKMFIDRMYSLCKFSDEEGIRSVVSGKTLALIATAGGPMQDNLEVLESQLRNPAAMLGCSFASCLFPDVRMEAGDLKNDPLAAERAQAFGRLLAS